MASLFGNNNTTQNNQSSLFGGNSSNTNQPQQPNNTFGSFGNTKPQQTPSLFGNATSTSGQPQQGANVTHQIPQNAGLFGSAATSQPQQGGLFGAAPTAQSQQTGNLFGAPASATSQPQSSGSLFGGALAAQQQQQPQAQQNNPLFGGTLGGQNQNTQTGSSLFGNTSNQNKPTLSLFGNQQQQQQQQQQQKPSLFGTSTSNASVPAQPSLFGAATTTNQPQQSSLFGSSLRQGGLTLGQSIANPQQSGATLGQVNTVPGVRIDLSNIRGTTRFNDLHDDLQAQITQIDNFIQQQISYQEQCAALMPKHAENVISIPPDVDFIKQKLQTAELAVDNNSSAIDQMRNIVRQDAQDARLSFRAIENLKLPQQFHYTGISWYGSGGAASQGVGAESTPPEDIVAYVERTAGEFKETLEAYTRNLLEIEAHLRTLETNVVQQSQQLLFQRSTDGGVRDKDEQVRELAAVLNEFEGAIVGVAERVGAVREGATDVIEQSRGGTTSNVGGNRLRR